MKFEPISLMIEYGPGDTPGHDGIQTDLDIERTSGVRHGRYHGKAACLAVLTASRIHKRLNNDASRLGLLCNGGPWNLQSSWDFLARAREAGPRFVNPIQFPSTLVSATATLAASAVGAHAFAYVIGHDHFAFFDVLKCAAQALRHDLAERVYALGLSVGGGRIEQVANASGLPQPVDAGLGFALDLNSDIGSVQLLQVGTDESQLANFSSAKIYEGNLEEGRISFPIPTALNGRSALGATAAVLIAAAVSYEQSLPLNERSQEFVVSLRSGANWGMAAIKLS